MASRSSLVVNARVHLPGAKSRAAVITHNVEYIANRPGADPSLTEADMRRDDLAERLGLAGYYAKRPGSTALFDQDGAISLRAARDRLIEADGALATIVVSVRREEAEELRLADKSEWQQWCRSNLVPALAVAMGIPESSVRWLAAEHENSVVSKHVHVIAWSSDGAFSSLMSKNGLERARNMLTDAALDPAIKAEMESRDVERGRVIDAVGSVSPSEIAVDLPAEGRISYEHLRRWHPECARQLASALEGLRGKRPELARAEADFRASVANCAELRGLVGEDRERYERSAMEDLRHREYNALLRTVAPDRTEAPPTPGRRSMRPTGGPATSRRRDEISVAEVRACVSEGGLEEARDAVRDGRPIPARVLDSCPTYRVALARAPGLARAVVLRELGAAPGKRGYQDTSDELARLTERTLARALSGALSVSASALASKITSEPVRKITEELIP